MFMVSFFLTLSFIFMLQKEGKITESDFMYFHVIIFIFSTEKEIAKLGINFVFQYSMVN